MLQYNSNLYQPISCTTTVWVLHQALSSEEHTDDDSKLVCAGKEVKGITGGELELLEAGTVSKGGQRLYVWPPGLEMAQGAELEWPLWVHPHMPGILQLRLVFFYVPTGSEMKYR